MAEGATPAENAYNDLKETATGLHRNHLSIPWK
jgi:hypothetical protein